MPADRPFRSNLEGSRPFFRGLRACCNPGPTGPAPTPLPQATLFSLESSPQASDRVRERRWALASALAVGLTLAGAGLAIHHLAQSSPPPAAAVDHGPLPAGVRDQVMALLDRHLLDPRLEEVRQGELREFRIKGRTRAPLAQTFYAGFRPAVVDRLMPLLRPYGEIISFDIASLDLPPARLRPLPKD